MKKFVAAFPVAVAVLAGTAHAQVYNFTLDGLQEVPPNPSRGTGTAVVTLDQVTNRLTWDIHYSGLFANVTAAHFHAPAAPGANAGVALGISGPAGSSGHIMGDAVISNTFEAQLLAGLSYVNIHTTQFPGGEIRGQVVDNPSCPCACDYDTTTGPNICDIFDFLSFQNGYDAGDPCSCDKDTSTGMGVCDIFDFLAFQNEYDTGCP